MKVLHVNHLLDPVTGGGTAERTFQLARFLSDLGAECGILTLDIGETRSYESLLTTEKIFKLPCINRRYYIHISWPFRIRRIVKGFDVIHLMGHWTLLNAIVAVICVRLNKPYVICPAGALKPYGRSLSLKRLYDFLVGRWIIKKANAWIAITKDEKKDFLAYGIPTESVEVIPNGIDPRQYQLAERSAINATRLEEKISNSPYILFLGRLNAIKGPDLLLEAFAQLAGQHPDVHLVFAGPDAGMLSSLRRISATSGMDKRIHFIGYVGGEDKVYLLRKAYCLVIPSRNEAMSIVVLEAGVCDTPVVFTNRCGLEEFEESNAGLSVPATVEAIRDGLIFALSNPVEMKERSNCLQNLVSNRFLWSTQAEHYLGLYQKLISQK